VSPPFVGKDPRGYDVVFDEEAWGHATPHHSSINSNFTIATQSLTDPSFILPNHSNARIKHTAEERYVLHLPALPGPGFVVVPARILKEDEVIAGIVLPAGTRAAVTVFFKEDRPGGRSIWVKK
jgi:hypothetical protein